ncbi:MAG: CCA tRNA nucleotidyltransferase [bacterium]|nr:CCA tRNA nucleotidyltransferase [bacterium]
MSLEEEQIQRSRTELSTSGSDFPSDEILVVLSKVEKPGYLATYQRVLEICRSVKESGGRALLVGGCVRDAMMRITPKDFDLEVYGLAAERIEKLARLHGRTSDVGKAFGILKVFSEDGFDIDISLPRTDSKTGTGHKGFAIETDPMMSIQDAARRRDFTINSLAADPLTGELFDYFGGVEDLKNRVLRITDAERFRDDPLRVLRALQFIGRFGLRLDPDSLPVLREMAPLLSQLPKERIGEEWRKLLLKSEKPSLGLTAGMTLDVLTHLHPEFVSLSQTPQEHDWHPEGDVWVHTLMSVDEAGQIIRREELSSDQALTVVLATLCHDLGKPQVTEMREGRITSYGHDQAGAEPAKKFLASIGVDGLTRDKVVGLVANHLVPTLFYIEEVVKGNKISDGAIRRLAQRIYPATIRELILVAEADHLGRGKFEDPENVQTLLLPTQDYPAGAWLLTRARQLEVESSRPRDLTMGRDWLNLGFKQGTHIGRLIALSNELREKGHTREAVLRLAYGLDTQETLDKFNLLLSSQSD